MAVDKWILNYKDTVFSKDIVNCSDDWLFNSASYKDWVKNYFVTTTSEGELFVVREGTCSAIPPCNYFIIQTTFRSRKGESSKNPLPQNYQHACTAVLLPYGKSIQRTCKWGPMATSFFQLPYVMRRFIWFKFRQTYSCK
jgi:hypothetical protein